MQNTQRGFIKAFLIIIVVLIIGSVAYAINSRVERSKQTGESVVPNITDKIAEPVVIPIKEKTPEIE